MEKKQGISHLSLRIITVLAIVGSIILLINKHNATGSDIAYELVVYAITISALTLTTLQSIAIAQQIRITRRSSGKITEAVNKLDELESAERRLAGAVMHDDVMERLIVKALHKAKVGENDTERERVAKIVRREIKEQN